MKTKRKLFYWLLALSLLSGAFLLPPVALGQDRDIPASLLTARSNLRAARDNHLAHEAEQNRCLREDEITINEINSLLSSQPRNWQALVTTRSYRNECINNHRGYLAQLRSAIANVDKDLYIIEDSIKYYANLR